MEIWGEISKHNYKCFVVFGTGEDLDGLLDTILLRQYESSALMLYIEIFNILAFAFDRNLVQQQSIFVMAQMLNSLENKSTVWTLYEVFNQEDDPSIEPAKREHLYIRFLSCVFIM